MYNRPLVVTLPFGLSYFRNIFLRFDHLWWLVYFYFKVKMLVSDLQKIQVARMCDAAPAEGPVPCWVIPRKQSSFTWC